MITPWEMYWLTRLEGIHNVSVFALIALLFAFVGAAILYGAALAEDDEDVARKAKASLKAIVSLLVLATAVLVFLPTMKEMAAIKVIPMIANSESVRKLGDVGNNMLDLANEWLLELKPKKAE